MKPIKAAKDLAIAINLMEKIQQWWATDKNLKRAYPAETLGKWHGSAKESRKNGVRTEHRYLHLQSWP